jgi:hypothetical protein
VRVAIAQHEEFTQKILNELDKLGLGERQRKLSILMGIHRELEKKINSYKQKGESIHALAI